MELEARTSYNIMIKLPNFELTRQVTSVAARTGGAEVQQNTAVRNASNTLDLLVCAMCKLKTLLVRYGIRFG